MKLFRGLRSESAPVAGGRVRSIEQHRLDELVRQLAFERDPASQTMLGLYRVKKAYPHLGMFRLGPNMFEETPVDWIMLSENEALVAHGLAARIAWDGDPAHLHGGWQRTVRDAYEHAADGRSRNTLVGLFIKVEDRFQAKGWAARVVAAMKDLGRKRGLSHLIIPLRLPTAYEQGHAAMEYAEFAYEKRDDGQYHDHWLRLHARLGAEVLGHCATSHQHALSVEDFHDHFEAERSAASGYRLARRNHEWYRAYVDVERDAVILNEGCVWVRHSLEPGR